MEPLAFAWQATGIDSIPPMHWHRFAQDQTTQIDGTLAFLGSTAPGRRCLHFWEFMLADWDTNVVSVVKNGGPDVSAIQGKVEALYEAVATHGYAIDRIVLDDEKGIGWWRLGGVPEKTEAEKVAILQDVWDDAEAFAMLPATVTAFDPEDFASNSPNYTQAHEAWQDYAAGLLVDVLRRVTLDTAQAILGYRPPCTNYEDAVHGFRVVTRNGTYIPSASMTDEYSPEFYLQSSGNLLNTLAKKPQWNQAILNCNRMRSIMSIPGARLVPWCDRPSRHPGYEVLWRAQERALSMLGARTRLYFNDGASAEEDAYAAMVWEGLAGTRFPAAPDLSELELDLDEVVF